MRIDNLKADELTAATRRTRALESQSPLGHSSVSEGALRVLSAEGLVVKGTARVDGELNGSGDLNWSGDVNASGDVNVSGTGRVRVGSAMTLDPSIASGAITFSNGAQVFTNASSIQVFKGSSVVQVSSSEVFVSDGSRTIVVNGSGIRVIGLPTKSGTGMYPGTLWQDPATNLLYRITS